MILIKEKTLFDNLDIKNIYNYSSKSPLRYPGGKTRAVQIIDRFIPKDLKTLISPFFGGGSLELFLANKGIKILGFDIFQPLVDFWQVLLNSAEELANEVIKYLPLSRDNFYKLQKLQFENLSKIEKATIFYVLNRCSYSGSTLSGGMSPGHPRFTKSSIERLYNFSNPNITVEKMDFKESLIQYQNVFTYLDPPYLIKNSLYGKNGDTHKDFDHDSLSDILSKRDKWILSYNDCPEIRKKYNKYQIINPIWKYGMSNNKISNEVLIFSKDFKE